MVQSMVWQSRLLECPDRPKGRQRRQTDALVALSQLLDWPTGKGFASVPGVAKRADVGEMTVKRAIIWAREAGWLKRTQRGHRLGDGTATASKWELLLPESQQTNSGSQQINSQAQQTNSTSQQTIPTGLLSESNQPESTPSGAALSDAAQVLVDRAKATPEEAQAIADEFEADPNIISARAVLNSKTDGALKTLVRKHRTAARPSAPSVRDLLNAPRCGHGEIPGRCALCRITQGGNR